MNILFVFCNYIRHLLVANTRHGTHSPFVYRLLVEVLYAEKQPDEAPEKVERLIVRLKKRFGEQQIYHIQAGLSGERPEQVIDQLWPELRRGDVLVLQGIYSCAGMKQLWRLIKTRPEVTITIDLFHVGLVFFHSGQARENFRIRY